MRPLEITRREAEAPLLVLWAMTEEVRLLAQIGAGLARCQPLDALLKDARLWGTRQVLIKRALQRVDGERAAAALVHAARIDRMIKGIAGGDVWDEFRQLSLRITAA